MVPRNTRTIIIKSAFPAGVSHAGVADIIGRSLSGQIDSIQVCPGGIIRVSFLDPQSKKSYDEAHHYFWWHLLSSFMFYSHYPCFSLFIPLWGK